MMHKWCKSCVLYFNKISGSSLDVTISQKPFKWFVQDCLLRLMVVDAISSAASEDVCTWEWSLIILIDIGLASTFHWSQTPLALWCCHWVATRAHFADCALHGQKILWRVGGPRFGMLWHWLKGLALMVKSIAIASVGNCTKEGRLATRWYWWSWTSVESIGGEPISVQSMCDLRGFLPAGSSVSSLPRFESINLSLALQLVSLVIEDMTRGLPRIVGRGCNLRKAPSFEQRRRRGHAGWPALCRSMLHITAYHRCPFGLKSQHGRAKCDEKSTVMSNGSGCVWNQVGQACHCCQPLEGGQLKEASGLSSGKEPSDDARGFFHVVLVVQVSCADLPLFKTSQAMARQGFPKSFPKKPRDMKGPIFLTSTTKLPGSIPTY